MIIDGKLKHPAATIPVAVWLFASALISFAVISRRHKVSAGLQRLYNIETVAKDSGKVVRNIIFLYWGIYLTPPNTICSVLGHEELSQIGD